MLKENIIIKTVKEIYALLTPKQRRKSPYMALLIFLTGIMDVLSFMFILPVISIASNLSKVTTNPYISKVYYFFGFTSPQYFLLFIISALVVVFIIKNIMATYFNYLQTAFSYDVAIHLTEKKFREFYAKDYLEITGENSNITASNVATVPVEFSNSIMTSIFMFFSEFIVVLLITIGIAALSFKLLLLLAVVLGSATIIFYRFIRRKSERMGVQKNKERYIMYQYLYQNIHGFIDVLLNNRISFFLSRFFKKQSKLYNIYTKLAVLEIVPNRFIEVAGVFAVWMIIFYSITAHMGEQFLINFLIVFAVAASRLMPSVNRIIVALVKIKSNYYVFDILREKPLKKGENNLERYLHQDKIDVPPFTNNLQFVNLSFRYYNDSPVVLKNLSFEVKKGEVIGFIGSSGSGKTTIFNIILKLLTETSGAFLVDGKPIAAEQITGWRHLIGYVRQDYYLLDASLAENIAFGVDRENIDLEKLNDAIDKSSLRDFVNRLPEGIDSHVGEHGGKLSGGQKQRIAIARSLYHDSEVILFDEATSALDNETENEIIETVNNLFGQKKTMLMIAHRYTTLKKCSRIFELSGGSIVQVHTYQDLLDKKLFVQ